MFLSVLGHPEGKGLHGEAAQGREGVMEQLLLPWEGIASSHGLGNPLRPNERQRGKGPAQQCPYNVLIAAQGRSIQVLLPLRYPQDALKPQLVLCLLVL